MKGIIRTAFVAGIFTITGCYYDVEEELYPSGGLSGCDTSNVTFSQVIAPVINTNCVSCHSQSLAQGNVNLEGFNNVKTYADNGLLLAVIRHEQGVTPMPQNGNKLSDCTISKIEKWVSEGSPDN